MIEEAPQPGSIGLTDVAGPVGLGIRVGQWLNGDGFTRFEHAFLVLDGGQLIEAQPGGAVIRPLSDYNGRRVVYVAPEGLTDVQREAICAAASSLVDTPYSGLDYLALAARRFHLPVPGLRRRIESSHHLICSQLCDLAYQRAGVELFAGRWNGYVTPADLYELLGREAQR